MICLIALPHRDHASQEHHDEGSSDHGQEPAESLVLALAVQCGPADSVLLGFSQRDGGVEEGVLVTSQIRARLADPGERIIEASAAVELARLTIRGDPVGGGGSETVHHPLGVGVFVQPAPQAGPCPGQRLVGEPHGVFVCGQEAGLHQGVDGIVVSGVEGDEGRGTGAQSGSPVSVMTTNRSMIERVAFCWSPGSCS